MCFMRLENINIPRKQIKLNSILLLRQVTCQAVQLKKGYGKSHQKKHFQQHKILFLFYFFFQLAIIASDKPHQLWCCHCASYSTNFKSQGIRKHCNPALRAFVPTGRSTRNSEPDLPSELLAVSSWGALPWPCSGTPSGEVGRLEMGELIRL